MGWLGLLQTQRMGSVQGEGETRDYHQRRRVRMPSFNCCHLSHRFYPRAIHTINWQTTCHNWGKNRVGAITFPDRTNIVDIVDSTDNFLRGHGYRTTVPPAPADSITATSTPIAADHTISSGLSDAAKIGIGVGTGFAVLMLLGALSAIWIILRRNHTNNGSSLDEAQTSLPMHNNKEMGPVEMPAMPALPPKSPFIPRPQFIDQRPQDPSGPWLMSCHAQRRENIPPSKSRYSAPSELMAPIGPVELPA
ncbi:hypothetical protein N656DRAFT_806213 [Canariomyces notabilis]|uniref:Mid2 domain-containing protein n=1 Tax=Canariomyces notabilis TaxID=2074819 RepID=A0AAN6TCW0_9PEZI|nr:hypothetical protein N656DRAFT_806213 [Canariomyces arenarius]